MGRYLNRLSDLLWAMARWAEGEHHLLARGTPRRGRGSTADGAEPADAVPTRRSTRTEEDERREHRDRRPPDSLPAGLVAVGVPVVSADGGPRPGGRHRRGRRGPGSHRARSGLVQAARVQRQGRPDPDVPCLGPPGSGPTDRSEPELVLVGLGDTGHAGRRPRARVAAPGRGRLRPRRGPGGRRPPSCFPPAPISTPAEPAPRWPRARCSPPTGTTPSAPGTSPEHWPRWPSSPASPTTTRRAAPGRRGAPGWPRRSAWPATWSTSHRAPSPPRSSPTPSSSASPTVAGVTVEVWDEERIAAERLGGLLGVARGSAQPPRLVRVEYRPADPIEIDGRVPHLALVGKGITFDSGGLSLKTADGHGDHEDRHGRGRRRAGRGGCRRRPRGPHPDHRHHPVDREHARRVGHQAR